MSNISDEHVPLENLPRDRRVMARERELAVGIGFIGLMFTGVGAAMVGSAFSHSTPNFLQLAMGGILLAIGVAMMGIAYGKYQSNKPKEIADPKPDPKEVIDANPESILDTHNPS